ncbi:hypothetical protein PTTG_10816 [Puccinia triticina 1-1 BBBD Race 1]|uniref:Uncharacterized protein n=1 Tax=Puccinia triticina (isolate 1-1 / race 1 (BBBD)) TaxID=630390 RepID=A0A180G553_PUCT1|nr:hypothetical protein PTTG_10816 [Puccinia triticina 1-1 BBBD Race 1]
MAKINVDPPQRKMVKILPKNKGLMFDGTDLERFLESYKQAAQQDGASEYDMARQIVFFVQRGEIRTVVRVLDGYASHDWTKLKASMLACWGRIEIVPFTLQNRSHNEAASPNQSSSPNRVTSSSLAESYRSNSVRGPPEDLKPFESIPVNPVEAPCFAVDLTPSVCYLDKEDRDVEPEPLDHSTEVSSHKGGPLIEKILSSQPSDSPYLAECSLSDPAREEQDKNESFKSLSTTAKKTVSTSSEVFDVSYPPGLGPVTDSDAGEKAMNTDPKLVKLVTDKPSHAYGALAKQIFLSSPLVIPSLAGGDNLKSSDFPSVSFPPGLSFSKAPTRAIPNSEEEEMSANLEHFKQPIKEPNVKSPAVGSPNYFARTNQSDPQGQYKGQDKDIKISLSEPFASSCQVGMFPADLVQKQHERASPPEVLLFNAILLPDPTPLQIRVLPGEPGQNLDHLHLVLGSIKTHLRFSFPVNPSNFLSSFVSSGEVDPSLLERRTGVGPNLFWTSEDLLRNEGKLLFFILILTAWFLHWAPLPIGLRDENKLHSSLLPLSPQHRSSHAVSFQDQDGAHPDSSFQDEDFVAQDNNGEIGEPQAYLILKAQAYEVENGTLRRDWRLTVPLSNFKLDEGQRILGTDSKWWVENMELRPVLGRRQRWEGNGVV